MRFSLAFAVALVLGVWCMHLAAAQEFRLCSYTDPTTSKKYDLTPLAKMFTAKSASTDPDNAGWRYYVSPCQPVRGQSRCVTTQPSSSVCQLDTKDTFSVGAINNGAVAPLPNGGEGFVVVFAPVGTRGSNISYICDPSAGEGKIKWTYIPPSTNPQPYIWLFEWRTAYACPSGGGGGGGGKGGSSDSGTLAGGWIFIICLASVTLVYFAGGLLVQKFYFHREGLELIPNSEFWLALPGLVKDGNIFVFNSVRRLFGRGYQQI